MLRRLSEPKQQPDREAGRLVREDAEVPACGAKGDGNLEDKVNAFLSELAKPYEHVRSAAAIDTEVANQPQFTDVPERLGVKRRCINGLDRERSVTMGNRASTRSLTAADLKDNLHDIQDNVVAPILMRYGRHIFLKFNDGAKGRAWLRNMFKRVNARQEEHGTRFTVNIGFTYEGLKALGLSQRSLDSFPEAFRVGCAGRAGDVGDVGPHAPEYWEGGLGGPDIHAMA